MKKTDYNTKISEIEKKLTDHNHDKYITTPEFNNLAAGVFTARLAQANLVTKTDFEWVSDSPLKDISFKAIMIMPNLLLQKPSKASKSKEHQLSLERRLDLWQNGEFEELPFEGETIQKLLTSVQRPSAIAEISRKFKRLMQKGNISAVLNLLTNNMGHGILPLDQKIIS